MNQSSSNLFPDSYSTGDYKWMTVESTPLVGSSPSYAAYSDNERSAKRKVSFRAQLENIQDTEDEAEPIQSQPTRQPVKRLPSPRDSLDATPSREAHSRRKQDSTSNTQTNKENRNVNDSHHHNPQQENSKRPPRKPSETLRDVTNNADLLSDDIPRDFHTGILLSSTPVTLKTEKKPELSGTKLNDTRDASGENRGQRNPDRTVEPEKQSEQPSWQVRDDQQQQKQKILNDVAALDIQKGPKVSTAVGPKNQDIVPPKLAALEIPDEASQQSTSSSLRSSPSELHSGQPILTPGNARDHIPLQTPADEVPSQSKSSPGIDCSSLINALTEAINKNVTLESELRRQEGFVTDLRKELDEIKQETFVSSSQVRNASVQAAVEQARPSLYNGDRPIEMSPGSLSGIKQDLHEILQILKDERQKEAQKGAGQDVGIQVTAVDTVEQESEKPAIDESENYKEHEERHHEKTVQQLEGTISQLLKDLEEERQISAQLRGKGRCLTKEDMPAPSEEERHQMYTELEMDRVDEMGVNELGNLVKNIMLQLNASLDKLPLRIQSVRDHLLREELYLHFANDIHKIVYKGQQITRQKLTEEQEIECLGIMVTRVSKLQKAANKGKIRKT